MVLWIGVDDTDSLQGMCTTFLATEIIRDLTEDLDLIGYPRLVRLNPNIPWKTRGNGAVCVSVGRGRGKPVVVGSIEGHPVRAYPRATGNAELDGVVTRVSVLIERWSDLAAQGTDPGLVVLHRKPRPGLYWRAVRSIVSRAEAREAIRGLGEWREWKSGRGVIGAAAACAWRPHDRTWEVLAYRDPDRWGSPRWVDPASVRRMDRRCPGTFNNYDYESGHVAITPRTPCPVLFGVRGYSPIHVVEAFRVLRSEHPDRWLVFLTNQGTDDHVNPGATDAPYGAGRFVGRVTAPTRTLAGGHAVFKLGLRDVTAYEPSKRFRDAVRALTPGDALEVVGSVRHEPPTINLEKFRVIDLAKIETKVANPSCARCGIRMKSRGRGAPFRCRRCGGQAPRNQALMVPVTRTLSPGWYEPPVGSRRHLSKPIARLRQPAARPSRSAAGPAARAVLFAAPEEALSEGITAGLRPKPGNPDAAL